MKRFLSKIGLLAVIGVGVGMAAKRLQRQSRWLDFRGRTVMITGGSRGLGLVLARKFADEGARLALVARSSDELERVAQELTARGANVMIAPCDVRNQAEVQQTVDRIIDHYGQIDVLVNNAGVIQVGPLDHQAMEDFDEALATHLKGPLHTMLAVIPAMRRQGSGRLVNIASIGGKIAIPHLLPYSTSKFALVGLSDGMRAELEKDNIYVTTVCPGLMRTGSHLNAQFKGRHEEEFTWFSIFDALPVTSTSAQKAADQIIDACRHGDPSLIITPQARLLAALNELSPWLTATGMAFFNRLLPTRTTERGDSRKIGWDSQSEWSPSLLTRLADRANEENNGLQGHAPIPMQDQKPLTELTKNKVNEVIQKMKENKPVAERMTRSIIVQGDIDYIYGLWADFENFPHFMQNVKSIKKTGPDTSHWIMKGPLGQTVEWNAKTTQLDKNQRIAWNSMANEKITTSGQVTFNPLPQDQVEVTVTLQYVPPAGKLGEIAANLLDRPDKKLEEDLHNFKRYAEEKQTSKTG